MPSVPPPLFPTLNTIDPNVAQCLEVAPSSIDPLSLNIPSGLTDTATGDARTTTPKIMDPCATCAVIHAITDADAFKLST